MNITRFINGQYRRPTGIVGRIIGGRMARSHEPENMWTISLLHVQPTDHILEIGFGPGTAIQRLSALATEGLVAGIDFSHTMVRVARTRNAQTIKSGRVKLNYGDAANLPFADTSFDKAFGIHTLYFWSDPQRILREVQRVLKVGSTLALTILPKEKWPGDGSGGEFCTVYSGDDVVRMLLDVGFTSAQVVMGDPSQFRELSVIGIK